MFACLKKLLVELLSHSGNSLADWTLEMKLLNCVEGQHNNKSSNYMLCIFLVNCNSLYSITLKNPCILNLE